MCLQSQFKRLSWRFSDTAGCSISASVGTGDPLIANDGEKRSLRSCDVRAEMDLSQNSRWASARRAVFAGKLVVEHEQPLADSESSNRETAYCYIRSRGRTM